MNKQIDVADILPTEMMENVRHFVEASYRAKCGADALPPIRTRHEAYGVLYEHFVRTCAAMDTVKGDMKMLATALTYTDQGFADVTEQTYAGLVECASAVAEMAAQALNVVFRISDMIAGTPTPLEEMAAQENIDDEDSKTNEEEEF